MKHIRGRNKIFQQLGVIPTNSRWAWCAMDPERSYAIFTLWKNEIANNSNSLWITDSPENWRNGAKDQKKILDFIITNNIPAYGLVYEPKNPTADPKKIGRIQIDYIIKLAISPSKRAILGKHKEKIPLFEFVQNITNLKGTTLNALLDLEIPPAGNDCPDRATTVKHFVVRDQKVRDYVINDAKGICEFCRKEGFLMNNSKKYLEAHHIIALSKSGRDTTDNVIALCANHHREAHYGSNAEELEKSFVECIKKRSIYNKVDFA